MTKKSAKKPLGNKVKTSPPVNQKGASSGYVANIKNAGKKKP
jgi:hypothetical protein